GHYHFARPGSMAVQGDYFLKRTTLKPGDVIALDWEDAGVTGADKDAWIRYVQARTPGHRVGLYCNKDFWINRDHTGFYGDFLWIADPDNAAGAPDVKADWLFHQYSEAGGIDRDYCKLTAAQLRQWAAGTTPTPLEDTLPTPADVWGYSHGDDPDVHQTLANAASAAAAAEKGVQTLLKGTPVTLTDAQLGQLAAKVAPLLPKPPSAADIATELAKRLQS
ncbi:GH25 family lysozyme, partial [Actinacidiphila rubida]